MALHRLKSEMLFLGCTRMGYRSGVCVPFCKFIGRLWGCGLFAVAFCFLKKG